MHELIQKYKKMQMDHKAYLTILHNAGEEIEYYHIDRLRLLDEIIGDLKSQDETRNRLENPYE